MFTQGKTILNMPLNKPIHNDNINGALFILEGMMIQILYPFSTSNIQFFSLVVISTFCLEFWRKLWPHRLTQLCVPLDNILVFYILTSKEVSKTSKCLFRFFSYYYSIHNDYFTADHPKHVITLVSLNVSRNKNWEWVNKKCECFGRASTVVNLLFKYYYRL